MKSGGGPLLVYASFNSALMWHVRLKGFKPNPEEIVLNLSSRALQNLFCYLGNLSLWINTFESGYTWNHSKRWGITTDIVPSQISSNDRSTDHHDHCWNPTLINHRSHLAASPDPKLVSRDHTLARSLSTRKIHFRVIPRTLIHRNRFRGEPAPS